MHAYVLIEAKVGVAHEVGEKTVGEIEASGVEQELLIQIPEVAGESQRIRSL